MSFEKMVIEVERLPIQFFSTNKYEQLTLLIK